MSKGPRRTVRGPLDELVGQLAEQSNANVDRINEMQKLIAQLQEEQREVTRVLSQVASMLLAHLDSEAQGGPIE